MSTTRRTVISGIAALPLLPACDGSPKGDSGGSDAPAEDPRAPLPESPWAGAAAPDDAAFPIGVQAGDPTPDGARVWTAYAGSAGLTLHTAVWDGAAWVDAGAVSVTADARGLVHHDLAGLPGDATVAYQFVDGDGAGSRIGRLQTALPADHTGRVRIGVTSCADQEHGEFPALPALVAAGPLDAFVWLGDFVYADSAVTFDEYRAVWEGNLRKESVRAVHANVAGIWSWDDHEVGNNWNPQTIDPAQRDAAFDAFFSLTPTRTTAPGRLWRSLRFGAAVELFVLDCRSERDLGAAQYVTREQLDWLKAGLSASTATWKIVANSVPITQMPPAWDAAGMGTDRWEGYPEQRAELLAHIEGMTGVMFISGDFHQTAVYRVDPTGPASRVFDVLCGPAGSFLNPAGQLLPEDDQYLYTDAIWSATSLECSVNGTCRITMIAEDGSVVLDMTVDVDGNVVETLVARHPWEE